MASLISSGTIAILIVILTVFEAAGLIYHRRRTGRGIALKSFLPNLLAGDFLLLAWALSAFGYGWTFSATALLAALLSHLADLALRWRG